MHTYLARRIQKFSKKYFSQEWTLRNQAEVGGWHIATPDGKNLSENHTLLDLALWFDAFEQGAARMLASLNMVPGGT